MAGWMKNSTPWSAHIRHPLPYLRDKDPFEVDPIWIETVVDTRVRLDPIAIDIPRIGLLRTEAPVDVDLLNTRVPKRVDGDANPFQQPSTPRRERETPAYLYQCCSMITRRQRAGPGVKRRNQATSIISETMLIVNYYAVMSTDSALLCRRRREGMQHSQGLDSGSR
jgi:hypothetical protein